MTSDCVSLTSGTFLNSQERLFLYKKAFPEVGASRTYLPFTESWLAENVSNTTDVIFRSILSL